jgi:hypothetical protein
VTILFEFQGGPWDGETFAGSPQSADIAEFDLDRATAYFWETHYGRIGDEFFITAQSSSRPEPSGKSNRFLAAWHKYRVAENERIGPDIWVVSHYVGAFRQTDVPDAHRCSWYERLVNLGIPEIAEVHGNFPEFPLRLT